MRHYDEDMIDFRVSDVWRDHYAAQGLTYDAGRRDRTAARQTPRHTSPRADWTALGEVLRSLLHPRIDVERLKQKSQHPQDANSRDSFEGIE